VAVLLVLAEFRCTEEGDAELRRHLDRTLEEARGVAGCLQATVWERPAERRYLFTTYWTDGEAVGRWVENEFHRTVLMPNFRRWCSEGSFSELLLEGDHDRARKCAACGRWTAARPGWSEQGPAACRQCGAPLPARLQEKPAPRLDPRDDEPGQAD
jgi:quinol monooxygenase YgiN